MGPQQSDINDGERPAMSFLTIPLLRASSANIFNSSFLIGGPPVLPAYLFAHAMGRELNFKAPQVAFIHHYMQPKGQVGKYEVFYPQQRRAASFTFGSNIGRDYSSKNKHALSLQPVATADLCVSLIIECDGLRTLEGVEAFLFNARFSGGVILGAGKVAIYESVEDALESIPSGYLVLDRRDLLELQDGKDQAQLLVEALGGRNQKCDGASWLSATNVGYAAISSVEKRRGVREGYPHAFAEPLIGLVQYRSIRKCEELDPSQILWRSEWVQSTVFRILQSDIKMKTIKIEI